VGNHTPQAAPKKNMYERRISHFCRNEKWRWYASSLCSCCGDHHYKGIPLHLNLTVEEVDKRNEEIRKE